MNVPSHTPVPCISGQAGMEIRWSADSTSPAISAASVGGARPSIGYPASTNPFVIPPMAYITPLGIPVVPPVKSM